MEDKNKLENKAVSPKNVESKKVRVNIHEEFKNDPPTGQFGGGFGGKQKKEKG